MENKKFLRRTTAFIAALSFTYFSCAYDMPSSMVYSKSTPSSAVTTTPKNTSVQESKNDTETTTSPVTAVSSTVPEVTGTECTTAVLPETTTSAKPAEVTTEAVTTTDTAVTTQVTTTEATTTTQVTTTEARTELSVIFSGYMKEDKAKNIDMKRDAINALKENEGVDAIINQDKYTLTIKGKDLSENLIFSALSNLKSYTLYTASGQSAKYRYLAVNSNDSDVNNKHLYRVTIDKNTIKLSLCILINPADKNDFLNRLKNHKSMRFQNIIDCENWLYADRDIGIVISRKGTSVLEGDSVNKQTIKLTNLSQNKFAYLTPTLEDNSFTLSQKNDDNEYKITARESDFNINIINPPSYNVKMYCDNIEASDSKIKWCDIDSKKIILTDTEEKPFAFQFEDKIYLSDDFNELLKDQKKANINAKNDLIDPDKKISVEIIPSDISLTVNFNNKNDDSNKEDKIKYEIEEGKIKFPTFITKGNETYYLSSVIKKNEEENLLLKKYTEMYNEKKSIKPDDTKESNNKIESMESYLFESNKDDIFDCFSFKFNEIISYDEDYEQPIITYIKLSDATGFNVISEGVKRNDIFTLPLLNTENPNNIYLSIIQPLDPDLSTPYQKKAPFTPNADNIETTVTSNVPDTEELTEENNSLNENGASNSITNDLKGKDFIVIYKTTNEKQTRITGSKLSSGINPESDTLEFIADLAFKLDQESTVVEILSISTKDGDEHKNIVAPQRFFYYDKTVPSVDENNIKLSNKEKSAEEVNIDSTWFNSGCTLEFDVSDQEKGKKINDNYPHINKLINDISHIKSIEIGPYKFDYSIDKKDFICTSSNTSDKVPNFKIGSDINKSFRYKIQDNKHHFSVDILPVTEDICFSEDIQITVTDFFDNKSSYTFKYNYDKTPPVINSIKLSNDLFNKPTSENKIVYNKEYDENEEIEILSIDRSDNIDIDEQRTEIKYFPDDHSKSLTMPVTLKDISNTSGKIEVTVYDIAGNSAKNYYLYDPESQTQAPAAISDDATTVIFDFAPPECTIDADIYTIDADKYTPFVKGTNKNEYWYQFFPENLKFTIIDMPSEKYNCSGLAEIQFDLIFISNPKIEYNKKYSNTIKINSGNIDDKKRIDSLADGCYFSATKNTDNNKFSISVKDSKGNIIYNDIFKDVDLESGKYVLGITAKDNAQKTSEQASYTFYLDNTPPKADNMSFKVTKNYSGDNLYSLPGIPYIHFEKSTDKKITVTVNSSDSNYSSGIESILLSFNDIDGKYIEPISLKNPNSNNDEEYNASWNAEFELPDTDFKGIISATITDNVGNTNNIDSIPSSSGYIHDTDNRHNNEKPPVISVPESEFHDKNGNRLFNHNIDKIPVIVEDLYAGLRKVKIQLENSETTSITDTEFEFQEEYAESITRYNEWSVLGSDKNLITKIATDVSVNDNKNGSTIVVSGEDLAGNYISNTSEKFSIDKTNPQVSLSFSSNTPDSTFTTYYNSPRTAYISITERNFDSAKVSSSGYSFSDEWNLVTQSGLVIPENSQQLNSDNFLDSDKHQNKIVFDKEGRYDLEVSCKDMCDNPSNTEKSGEFILDFTAPELKVTFDNNDSRNGNYFSKSRNAVIEINEPNFDPSRVVITGTRNGSADGFPVVNGKLNGSDIVWTTSGGNVHKATIPITEDGFYVINVSVTDKAGNKSAPLSKEFYIDQKAPDIKINGTEDHKAYNGDVKPVIEISDINIDPDTVRISLTGNKNGDSVKLEGTSEISDGKYIFTADDIPHIQENDDIYSLSVSASDRAGNPASANIRFSVNRFGSTFEPDERSAALNGTIVNDPGDIVIYEINPDSHNDNFKATVKVTKNGSNTVLEEGKDFTAEPSTDSSSGWTRYTYTIRSEYFKDDGSYEITVYSEDKAENKNLSSSILKFSVDNTKPSVTYISVSEGGSYKTDSMEVTAKLSDNLGIDPDSIHVIINQKQINDSEVRYDAESAEISFMLLSLNSTQSVQILASDMAGNSLDPIEATINNLFVSPSSARILMHKAWFRIAAAGAGIVAAAAGAFLIFKKRKKL